jgi:hypothetical protein
MLFLGFALLGLFGIVLAVVVIRSNRRIAREGTASARWLIARRWSGLLSIALGIGSYFIWYPLHDHGETWRVMGFPFFAAVFDPHGSDYVGITTIPAVIGNFLFFASLPQFILWATSGYRGRGA